MSIFSAIFKKHNRQIENTYSTVQVPPKIAKFDKVSYEQYRNDVLKVLPESEESEIKKTYDTILLPVRATSGSAGYDIHTTTSFRLKSGEAIIIPTGLRCSIADGWFMMLAPRSGLGFKWYTRLANTVGIIDADYFFADNEGHIMLKLRRETDGEDTREMAINVGDSVAQAIFIPFGITHNDAARGVRRGGMGSTGK